MKRATGLLSFLLNYLQMLAKHLQRCKLELPAKEVALVVVDEILESDCSMITKPRRSVINISFKCML